MVERVSIAVFGSSEPLPGDRLYEQARELGVLLAEAGFAVVTGGYGGVMEGASRGAREQGGPTLGVTCETFGHRTPNRYLDHAVHTPDLFLRQRELVERSSGYVVLQGRAGTISELALLWALHRAGCLERRPVVLLGRYWTEFLHLLESNGTLENSQRDVTRLVNTPREAVAALRASTGRSRGA
jgi:uncharacterized protein (TIGR00730 family)